MAQDKRFSHITVNAAADDDIVIQAGAPASVAEGAESPAPGVAAHDEAAWQGSVQQAPDAPSVADESPVEDSTTAAAEASAAAAASAEAADAAQPAPADAAWREQTLEDLEAGPMSNMQKIVLGAAAAFIIVALVWYFCFMR